MNKRVLFAGMLMSSVAHAQESSTARRIRPRRNSQWLVQEGDALVLVEDGVDFRGQDNNFLLVNLATRETGRRQIVTTVNRILTDNPELARTGIGYRDHSWFSAGFMPAGHYVFNSNTSTGAYRQSCFNDSAPIFEFRAGVANIVCRDTQPGGTAYEQFAATGAMPEVNPQIVADVTELLDGYPELRAQPAIAPIVDIVDMSNTRNVRYCEAGPYVSILPPRSET